MESKQEISTVEKPIKAKRDKWVNIKVTEAERDEWQAYALSEKMNLSDVFRQLISEKIGIDAQLVNLPIKKKQQRIMRRADPELLRELAKVGNNLNQISRWANTYKTDADALEVMQVLLSIQRALPNAH